jgi:hypothetical protein
MTYDKAAIRYLSNQNLTEIKWSQHTFEQLVDGVRHYLSTETERDAAYVRKE